jgi:peptide deformylase
MLLSPCQPWDIIDPPRSAEQLEQDLIDTMLNEHALGLAANQVGIPYSVFAMHTRTNDQVLVLFNPEIVSASDDAWMAPEGCLSFPGIELNIARPRIVVGKWQDSHGQWHQREFKEIDAKCFLHELDHLNGHVFKDLVSDLKFQWAQKKAQQK